MCKLVRFGLLRGSLTNRDSLLRRDHRSLAAHASKPVDLSVGERAEEDVQHFIIHILVANLTLKDPRSSPFALGILHGNANRGPPRSDELCGLTLLYRNLETVFLRIHPSSIADGIQRVADARVVDFRAPEHCRYQRVTLVGVVTAPGYAPLFCQQHHSIFCNGALNVKSDQSVLCGKLADGLFCNGSDLRADLCRCLESLDDGGFTGFEKILLSSIGGNDCKFLRNGKIPL